MSSVSLANSIKHLSESKRIVGLFTTGTTASGLNKSSDIDLVVILDSNDKRVKSVYTTIDNRFADIFFFDVDFVKKAARLDSIPANGFEGMFISWLAKGKIEKDETGILSQIKNNSKTRLESLTIPFEEKQESWFKINYNFIANQRYFKSEDSLYHMALEIRLSYSIVELIVAYFTLRGIPWRGEKEAIAYLEKNDTSALEIFLEYTKSQSLKQKFDAYESLFRATLNNEFQKWEKDFLIVKDDKNQINESLNKYLQELLGK